MVPISFFGVCNIGRYFSISQLGAGWPRSCADSDLNVIGRCGNEGRCVRRFTGSHYAAAVRRSILVQLDFGFSDD